MGSMRRNHPQPTREMAVGEMAVSRWKESGELTFASWNQLGGWLRAIDALRRVA